MISKSLIVFFLACALAAANPIQKGPAPQIQNLADFYSLLDVAHKQIKQTYEQTVQPFQKTYKTLVEASKNGREYSQDKIEQLRSEFLEITAKSLDLLSDVENTFFMGIIANLRKFVNDLISAVGVLAGGYSQLQQINQNFQPGQRPGSQNTQNPHNPLNNFDFKNLMEGLKGQLNLPGFQPSQSKESPNIGNMNLMPSIPSQFSQFAPNSLPTNLNQLGGFIPQKGLESVGNKFNGFLNQAQGTFNGGLSESSGNNFKGLLNQAQGALNGGLNGIPNNAFNSIINSIPGILGGIEKNMNDMSQTLTILQNQMYQTVSTQINQLKEALTQWSNKVEDFLANGKQVVESQSSTGGFLPGVPLPPSNEGAFGKFGQKIGQSIGSGVDKFTKFVGNIINPGKFFSKNE